MLTVLLVVLAVGCAVRAIRSTRLLAAAIWLAGLSALSAVLLYRLGAQQVAVVELSVGAGLVTVLFVFAISIAGDDVLSERESLPHTITLPLIALFLVLLGAMALPTDQLETTVAETGFAAVFWGDRAMDVLLQLVLIFTGVICMLGILADVRKPVRYRAADVPKAHIKPALEDRRVTSQIQRVTVERETAREQDEVKA